MSGPESASDYVRVINGVRLELETAGNPAYAVVSIDATGEAFISPMVYATVSPAADYGSRIQREAGPDEHVYVVSRSAAGKRAMFTIVDPKTLKKLHQRLEVIEESFVETDGPI
jgi:hypothetical protein